MKKKTKQDFQETIKAEHCECCSICAYPNPSLTHSLACPRPRQPHAWVFPAWPHPPSPFWGCLKILGRVRLRSLRENVCWGGGPIPWGVAGAAEPTAQLSGLARALG